MDAENHPVYVGDKYQCQSCSRRFKVNEIVMVDTRKDLVFCSSDFGNPMSCIVRGTMKLGLIVVANAMRFHGNT